MKNLKDPVELYYVVFPWTKMGDTFKILKNKSKNLKKIFFFSAISALFIILCFGIFYSIKNYKKIKEIRAEKFKNKWLDSIAVLPFVNLTINKENDYLSDGISEEIINVLSHLKNLKVCARTSTFSFKGKEIDIKTIGRKLGVNLVLEGSLREAGEKFKVTAQLIQAKDGFHLWSESFILENIDPLILQEKIAIEIVKKFKGNMEINEIKIKNRATENLIAYNLYLKGRLKWNKRTAEGLKEAVKCYESALELDPNFALAELGIAESYVIMPYYGLLSNEESYAFAKKYALSALRKCPELAEAYATLGVIYGAYEWNWQESIKAFERAIYIKPSYATAHQWYSFHLRRIGELDKALEQAKLAQELDPLSTVIRSTVADAYYDRREWEKAKEIYNDILSNDKDFQGAHLYLSGIFINQGLYDEAISQIKMEKGISDQWAVLKKMYEGRILAHCGKREEALKIANDIELKIIKEKKTYYMFLVLIYCSMNEENISLKYLENALEARDAYFFLFMWEPVFDPIRSKSEFKNFIIKFNLPKTIAKYTINNNKS